MADFAGGAAPEILFKREGLSWYPATCEEARENSAGSPEDGVRASGGPISIENHPQDGRVSIQEDGTVQTLVGQMGTGGNNVPLILDDGTRLPNVLSFHMTQDPCVTEEKTLCLSTGNPDHGQCCIGVAIPIADKATRYKGGGETRHGDGAGNGLGIGEPGAPANTLTVADRHAVCYAVGRDYRTVHENVAGTLTNSEAPESVVYPKIAGTLTAKMAKGTGGPAGDECQNLVIEPPEYIVRRLTPLECGRLQGFPDGWTNIEISEPAAADVRYWQRVWTEWWCLVGRDKGQKMPKTEAQVKRWLMKEPSDSDLYKMWGNGIALPCAAYVMEGIALELQKGV